MVSSISATANGDGAYQTGFICWRAAEDGFNDWKLSGVKLNVGALAFDPSTAIEATDPYAPGGFNGGNYYNGGPFLVGEATSPEIFTAFNYTNAIPSWNASTPAGTWVEIQFRAQYGARWSKWYCLGIWASDDSTIRRHSVPSQGDTDGSVAVDTFVASKEEQTTSKFQLKLRLFSTDGKSIPSVQNASIAYSTSAPKSAGVSAGDPARWNRLIDVPQCAQMVYPDGGEVWCSPTSTSMVLAYLDHSTDACEPRVRAAVDGVYDWIYDGHGNWPFNTAYAATRGYEAYVARLTGLAKAEEYVAAELPLIMSVAWSKGELTGVNSASSNGHLLVLVGFDASGNPIVNDPDAPRDETVQRTYLRSEFEPLWLKTSGGTVYLIYRHGAIVPAIP